MNRDTASEIAGWDSPSGAQKGFDIWSYVQVLRKRKWHALFFLAAVVGLVAFYTLRQTKIYRATATLQIDPQAPRVLGREVEAVADLGTGSYWSNQEFYETQYHILRSHEVAARVAAAHALGSHRTFLGVPEDADVFEPVNDADAAEMLRAMIVVDPVKDSRLVQVSVDHPDPALARLLANAVAHAYVDYNGDVALESTVNARDWLFKQADVWAKTLGDAEQRVVDFMKANNLLSVSLEDQRNQLANEMDSVAQRLAETRFHRYQLEAKRAQIQEQAARSGVTGVSIAEVLDSAVIQTMKAKLFEKNLERLALDAQGYLENHPRWTQITEEVTEIRRGMRGEIGTILQAIETDYGATVAYEAELQARMDALQAQALDLGGKELRHTQLRREKENAEKIYSLIQQRSEEANLSTELSQVNNVRVLDDALDPGDPIRPRVKLNLALAIIVGLLGGIGLAFLLEALDTSVKTQEDIEKGLGLAFLGIMPTFGSASGVRGGSGRGRRRRRRRDEESRPDLYCHDNPKSSAAECARSIRTNILFMSPDKPPRRVLVTSPGPREGKTTVAVTLAVTMAQSGSHVLLVDTDMRRPRIHRAFGVDADDGLSTAVLGTRKVEDLIRPTRVPGLDILPCGPTPPNPAELIHTNRFRELVEQIDRLYDRIVFDSPPVIAVTDPVVLSRHVDGVVLVIKSLVTNRKAAKHSVKQLRDVGANLLGAVLNDIDIENREYGYYHYYYYRKYGYYYGEREEGTAQVGKTPRTDEAETSGSDGPSNGSRVDDRPGG